MPEEQEQQVKLDDACELWTVTTGAGPPIVLCHGGPGFWDNLGPIAGMVDDLVTVHRWDQRGSGRSSPVGPYSIAQFVSDLESLRLHWGYDKWIVGGHSFGASLALSYAMTHPGRCRAVLYISGVGIGQEWHGAYREERLSRLGEKADRWRALRGMSRSAEEERELAVLSWSTDFASRDEAARLAEEEMLATGFPDRFQPNDEANRTINLEMNAWNEADLIEACASISMSVLVLHGVDDPRPAWALDSLVSALPNAQFELLSACGHLPWKEAPARTRDVLRSFLGELEAEKRR